MTKEEIEYYHNSGLMPDWVYYQVNGKTAQENYIDIVMKRDQEYRDLLNEREVEESISKSLEETIGKCLDDILKEFNKK